jgi:membrane protein
MKLLTTLEHNLSKVKPPFFDGLSIWDILSFFVRGIYQGAITSRAGSVSFSFFLALFPGIIFIFTLIAYLPLDVFRKNSSAFWKMYYLQARMKWPSMQ